MMRANLAAIVPAASLAGPAGAAPVADALIVGDLPQTATAGTTGPLDLLARCAPSLRDRSAR